MKYILIENNIIATHEDDPAYQDIALAYGENAYEYVTDESLPQSEMGYLPISDELRDSLKAIYFGTEQRREREYRSNKCIEWNGEMITVDKCNSLIVKYLGDDEEKYNELIAKKAEAKAEIRARIV